MMRFHNIIPVSFLNILGYLRGLQLRVGMGLAYRYTQIHTTFSITIFIFKNISTHYTLQFTDYKNKNLCGRSLGQIFWGARFMSISVIIIIIIYILYNIKVTMYYKKILKTLTPFKLRLCFQLYPYCTHITQLKNI